VPDSRSETPAFVPGLVSVSLVTTNESCWLPGCIQSTRRQTYQPIEIVVVDNASTDGTRELMSALDPEAVLVCNEANRGFAESHNRGIQRARGEFVLVMNPDVVLDEHFVETLVHAAQSYPEAAAFTGKLLQMRERPGDVEPARLDLTGFFPMRNGGTWDRGLHAEDGPKWSTADEVFGVSGCAALLRREALIDVAEDREYFDEAFFMYHEDIDLAWRLQLRGWRARYEPGAVAWHVRNFFADTPRRARSPLRNHHLTKNRYLVWAKDYPPLVLVRNSLNLAIWTLSALAYLAVFERRSLPALYEMLSLLPRSLRRRRVIMRRRMVSQRAALEWFVWSQRERERCGVARGNLWLERLRQLFARGDRPAPADTSAG
jgi:GT2 family glycosyltransferase